MSRYAVFRDQAEIGRFAKKAEARAIGKQAYEGGRIIKVQDLHQATRPENRTTQYDPRDGSWVPVVH